MIYFCQVLSHKVKWKRIYFKFNKEVGAVYMCVSRGMLYILSLCFSIVSFFLPVTQIEFSFYYCLWIPKHINPTGKCLQSSETLMNEIFFFLDYYYMYSYMFFSKNFSVTENSAAGKVFTSFIRCVTICVEI